MALNAPLYNRIKALSRQSYPMHMPGHKRNGLFIDDDLLQLDITEIDGSDNMHHSEDVILEAEREFARLNGCNVSLFLVNGGSSGVLTALVGTLREGDEVIVCRNAHKSVHNALVICGAIPVYIYPEMLPNRLRGGISALALSEAFKAHPNARAVVVTSPTYEGFTSDMASLADICHQNNAILIADETHGAHFSFSNRFPKTAILQGADISINSWHKTLPAINQSAVININTARVDMESIREAYSMVQTTSPSYIMLTLMDKARAIFEDDSTIFEHYTSYLLKIRQRLSGLKNMRLVGRDFLYMDEGGHSCGIEHSKTITDYDISKLVIHTGANFSGKALAQILLKEYNIQTELAEEEYIIAMSSVADTMEALDAFVTALERIDENIPPYVCSAEENNLPLFAVPEVSPRMAFYANKELVALDDAVGRLCGECVTPFPPDIPMLAVGERITGEHIAKIKCYLDMGITLIGVDKNKIKILS